MGWPVAGAVPGVQLAQGHADDGRDAPDRHHRNDAWRTLRAALPVVAFLTAATLGFLVLYMA